MKMQVNTMYLNMINDELKRIYGEKVYRIALNGGMTCPNRDGKIDTRGCIFCSAGGSGDFAEDYRCDITTQIESGKLRIQSKAPKCRKFIAYFQAYTNTYASTDYLRKIFTEAIQHPDVVILSIATRPDCLPTEVLDLLEELNQIKPVWVELGMQTVKEASAQFIRRGYCLDVYDQAVQSLKGRNIKVITHIILGLPGETKEDIYASVRHVASQHVYGVKLQLLHILEHTDLADYYRAHPFPVFTLEDYIETVAHCVELLPRDITIHRLTGDGPKKILIEPKWSGNKRMVLNTMNKYLREHDVEQGAKRKARISS